MVRLHAWLDEMQVLPIHLICIMVPEITKLESRIHGALTFTIYETIIEWASDLSLVKLSAQRKIGHGYYESSLDFSFVVYYSLTIRYSNNR